MADFRMECEKCGQHIEVPEEMAGETAECPSCGVEIVIPIPSDEADPNPAPSAPEETESPPAPEAPEPSKRSFGKSLLAAAGAAASEAKRGAKITGLKAQIEKLRRVDLQRAYRELGQKAYEIRFDSGTHGEAYAEIESLEARIDEKRAGVHADEHGTVADKAKAAASTAKMKAEAEALAHTRNTRFADLGKGVVSGKAVPPPELTNEMTSASDTQERIDLLTQELSATASDGSARDRLAAASHSMVEDAAHASKSASQDLRKLKLSRKRLLIPASGLAVIIIGAILWNVIRDGGDETPRGRHSSRSSGHRDSKGFSAASDGRDQLLDLEAKLLTAVLADLVTKQSIDRSLDMLGICNYLRLGMSSRDVNRVVDLQGSGAFPLCHTAVGVDEVPDYGSADFRLLRQRRFSNVWELEFDYMSPVFKNNGAVVGVSVVDDRVQELALSRDRPAFGEDDIEIFKACNSQGGEWEEWSDYKVRTVATRFEERTGKRSPLKGGWTRVGDGATLQLLASGSAETLVLSTPDANKALAARSEVSWSNEATVSASVSPEKVLEAFLVAWETQSSTGNKSNGYHLSPIESVLAWKGILVSAPSFGINDHEILSVDETRVTNEPKGWTRAYSFDVRVQLRARNGSTAGTKRVRGKLRHGESGTWQILVY